MGCVCDAGYSGPDCSDRACKFGIDPLYNDDVATARISNWTVNIFTEEKTGVPTVVSGTYSITFFDVFGEDWETVPISANAYCDEVVLALEGIPNNVIPLNSVLCLDDRKQEVVSDRFRLNSADYDIWRSFILAFPQNPGKLKPLRVNFYLDGPRPTLTTEEEEYSLRSLVYADGFSGEFIDYVPDLCEGVQVTLGFDFSKGYFLDDLDFRELAKIKRCLGDSDGNTNQDSYERSEVYNWDYGSYTHPHLIKLVDANRNVEVLLCNSTNSYNPTTDQRGSCQWAEPAGFYLPLRFDKADDTFYVFGSNGLTDFMSLAFSNGAFPDAAGEFTSVQENDARFNVFTTKGFLTSVNGFKDDTDIAANSAHHPNSMYQRPLTSDDTSHIHWHGPETVNNTAEDGEIDGPNVGQQKYRIDCETFNSDQYPTFANTSRAGQCLQKGDLVMFFDVDGTMNPNTANTAATASPLFHNIYTVEKIFYDRDKSDPKTTEWTSQGSIVLDKNPNFYYSHGFKDLMAWKFEFPFQQNGYEYVSECSGRGLCNHGSGVCECFTGHTSDDCSVQNTLAK